MDPHLSFAEVALSVIGIGLTASFGGWATVVYKAANAMQNDLKAAVGELSKLREEIHRDRLLNERRFVRLEQMAGLRDHDND